VNIALINHEFPPLASGVGSYVSDLANNLARQVDVTVITGNYGNEDLFEQRNRNLRIYRLSTPSVAPRFVWFQLKNKNKIKNILEKNKIDVLHGQGTACAFLLSKSFFRKPKIVTHHGDPRQDFIQFCESPLRYKLSGEFFQYGLAYPLWRSLAKTEYLMADKVITFSRFVEESLQRTFGVKKDTAIIPQGIDPDKILAIKNRQNVKEDNSIFFSGRLIWRKGILYLLKAFQRIHHEIPDLRLKIFGEGPLKGIIHDFIKKKGLEEHVTCYGYVSYSELIKEICKSYFAVLPSLFEASSILMLEVMVCRRHVLAFDLPFLEGELMHMDNAYLAPFGEATLAQAIIDLYNNKSLREKLGVNSYQHVINFHSWSKLADAYVKIYRSFC